MSIKRKLIGYLSNGKIFSLVLKHYENNREHRWKRMMLKKGPETVINYMWNNQAMPYRLNIENPRTFNEKIQWLKLYWYNPTARICANKLHVKEYVRQCGIEEILNNTIDVYDDVKQIRWDELPNQFVMKSTHDSGHIVICKNKEDIDIKQAEKKMQKWIKEDYFYVGEWQYAGEKKIICEEYIQPADGVDLTDYKFFCFNGEPKFVQVDIGRYTKHRRNYYDLSWNLLDIKITYEIEKDMKICKPKSFDKMVEYARKLSQEFGFVRVDLYDNDGKVIFGELTFFPGGGYEPVVPYEMDCKIGDMIKLPNKKDEPWKVIGKEYGINIPNV